MAKVLCHGVNQKARFFKIKPTKEGISEEYVLYLPACVKCGNKTLIIQRIDKNNEPVEPVRLKQKKIDEFLKAMTVLEEENKGFAKSVRASKHYLNYSEYGIKKRCYQNLSGTRIGRVDTDLFDNLKFLYKSVV